MKISDFRPASESDFPNTKIKEVFEILDPAQKAIKDLVRLTQGRIGLDNTNEEIVQVDLTPATWNTVELQRISAGPPKGAWPILVDLVGGWITGWGCEIVDDSHIKVYLALTNAGGAVTTGSYTTRILVKGA